jgi:hypothetical protein
MITIYNCRTSGVLSTPVYRCRIGSDHFDSLQSNCEGQTVESTLGYALTSPVVTAATTKAHVATCTSGTCTNATEPNGFSRKVVYDTGYRTTADSDIANLTTTTEWDVDSSGNPRKDLVLSSTDPTGVKSTTIYDYADRPTDRYGPAKSNWFGSDRKPASGTEPISGQTYVNLVPHTQTGYDESINGLATAYYNVDSATNGTGQATKVLQNAPALHATGIGPTNGDVVKTWNGTPPFTPDTGKGWGASLTGFIHLTSNGNYNFRLRSDDGAILWIDDTVVAGDWADGAVRDHTAIAFNNTGGDSWHRIGVSYYNKTGDSDAALSLYMTPPGGSETSALGSLLKPGYGLATTNKVFDSQIGDTVTTNNYGSTPELGQLQSATADPSGLTIPPAPPTKRRAPAHTSAKPARPFLAGPRPITPTMAPRKRTTTRVCRVVRRSAKPAWLSSRPRPTPMVRVLSLVERPR